MLFLYFFTADDDTDITKLEAGDAFYAEATSDVAIGSGDCPVIGQCAVDHAAWPIIEHQRPNHTSTGELTHWAVRVAEDLYSELDRRAITAEEAALFPNTAHCRGPKVEYRLARIISSGRGPMRAHLWWQRQIEHTPPISEQIVSDADALSIGVRIEINEPWSGNLDKVLKQLRRCGAPAGRSLSSDQKRCTTRSCVRR